MFSGDGSRDVSGGQPLDERQRDDGSLNLKFPRAAAKLIPMIPAHTTSPIKIPPSESEIAVNGTARAIDTTASTLGV